MKQLLQYPRTGVTTTAEVPASHRERGQLLVRVAASLVSAGTERMVVEFANKGLLEKARARPDLARQVLEKARREGILTTLDSVRTRLDQPLALGYSCAGTVIDSGENVDGFQIGDRVACAGGGYAVHAEIVSVPQNLLVKLPERVDDESAAFTTLGAIALQGIRLANVKLGECVVVIGLGLLGQLATQMLKAAGCTVIGLDIRPERAELAKHLGADAVSTDPEQCSSLCSQLSGGQGADAVLITADTKSNQPVELAGEIARDKGVVVAVGAVGMALPRKVYYEKELVFHISRSYGPGRYDSQYEEGGHDYPIGYVRWTENRNMHAFVQLVAAGKVNVQSLITHRFPIAEAAKAYHVITGKTGKPCLGVLITYPVAGDDVSSQTLLARRIELKQLSALSPQPSAIRIGLLGAGNFAMATLLPAMKKIRGIEYVGICTATGLSARHAGDKFGFRYCTTDESALLNDADITTVVIATRHHLHARQVVAALRAGKHVFCEKPLCLTEGELAEIVHILDPRSPIFGPDSELPTPNSELRTPNSSFLMVGFNRRFAPMAIQLKEFFTDVREPLVMHYRVNAGHIPPDHWVHDPQQGGGRIIGEVCHFVDFLTFLAGALPLDVHACALPNQGRYRDDNVVITIEFANSSLGTITYVANGDKAFPKERVEVFGGGCAAVLDDFRRLELVRYGHSKTVKSFLRQDKGHRGEWEALVNALSKPGVPPIALPEIVATTLTTFRIVESLASGARLAVGNVVEQQKNANGHGI